METLVVPVPPDQGRLKFRVQPKQIEFKDHGKSRLEESEDSVPLYRNMQPKGRFRTGDWNLEYFHGRRGQGI